ncbi:hypothetical protein MXD63_44120, partial [Frankia sp. Cpl3]|nr:hypothetical protein [Frankia sp. Cpl3]
GYDIITIEEGSAMGGFGSAVQEFYAAEGDHSMLVQTIGVPDYFVEHGSVKEQRQEVGLTAENIASHVRTLLPVSKQRA